MLQTSGVAGPYSVALGPRCYTGVVETTEMGGYPVLEHLRLITGGPVLWAPGVDGAVVLSTRGGDFQLTLGQDVSIGYLDHDATSVHLYLEESFTFTVLTPEAAVHLAYTYAATEPGGYRNRPLHTIEARMPEEQRDDRQCR